jgi:hypothetical protein
MFILLVKVVMFTLHIWYPLLGTIVNGIIAVLWIVSMYGQMGPDHSDPKHSSDIAWYITKSCSYGNATGDAHYCLMAKGTFATTVIMTYASPKSSHPSKSRQSTSLTTPQVNLPLQLRPRNLLPHPNSR